MRWQSALFDRDLWRPDIVRLALWILLIAETIAALMATRPWLMGDSGVYIELAKSLSEGRYGSFTAHGFEPDTLRPPGYPAILALLLFVLKLPPVVVVALQGGAYLLCLLLVERLLTGWKLSPLPLLLLATVYPFGLAYAVSIATEAWAMLGVTTIAFLLARSSTIRQFALIGLIAGLTALVRSDLILLPIALAAVVGIRQRNSGKAIARAAAILACAGLTLTPYAVWNLANFGRFSPVPLAGAAGPSLHIATWQRKVRLEDIVALINGGTTERAERSGLAAEVRAINRWVGVPPGTGAWNPAVYPDNATRIRMARLFGETARRRIKADPAGYAAHVGRNFWDLWNTGRYPPALPPVAVAGLTMVAAAVYLLGMAGAAVVVVQRKRWPMAASLVAIVLYPLAIHAWLHTEARYTAAVRPLLLMFASIMISWLWARLQANSAHARPARREGE